MEVNSKIGFVAAAAIGAAVSTATNIVVKPETKPEKIALATWMRNYEAEHGKLFLMDYDWNTHERIWKRPDGKVIRVAEKDGFRVTVVGEIEKGE